MTAATSLSASEIRRLDHILAQMTSDAKHPITRQRAEKLRAFVLSPTLDAWDTLYRTALDRQGSLSLWAATCMVSRFQSAVAVDEKGRRRWNWKTPAEPRDFLRALEFATS